jgi:hypothetical protein
MLKVLTLMAVTFVISGCTLFPTTNTSTTAKSDGGIWRSIDAGKLFSQAGDLLTTKGKVFNLNNLGVTQIVFDPSDANTIYALTETKGIFYSLDGANSWAQFKSLNTGLVKDLVVDPTNKCIIYALVGNKLFKSENCGRDFNNTYYHQKANVILTKVAVDAKFPNTVYVGTNEGEILKSTDGGHAWLTTMRENKDTVMDIIIDPIDTRIIYVGSAKSGIFKTIDAGQNWNNLGAGLASYAGSHEYKKLIIDPATPNGLIFISKFGLLKTVDGGDSWQVIELLPNAKSTTIVAVAVNPKNSDEFYYATPTTLVKTIDGGLKWSSKKMPFSTRVATGIYVSPANSNIVYITTQLIKK